MNWRVVCSCQIHARKPRPWRALLRTATRGAAVLLGIPLAFAAIDLPAARRALADLRPMKNVMPVQEERMLPIFTTESVKKQFLDPQQPLTLDVFKESYFRTHVPYGEIIFREARKNDLSPELVAAMVHTESDFRPTLVSHKAAQGLMQIVPATGAEVAQKLNWPNYQNSDIYKPYINVTFGVYYLKEQLDTFDNNVYAALAAYNAGPGASSEWYKISNGDPDLFLQAISYDQTQMYVRRIYEQYETYESIYGAK